MSATYGRVGTWSGWISSLLSSGVLLLLLSAPVAAQEAEGARPRAENGGQVGRAFAFIGGTAVGLLTHEGGHLVFDVAFDASPLFRRVEFAGIPFVAITHRGGLSPRREYSISAAGFWAQDALGEWVLTRRPHLGEHRPPFAKSVLAWSAASSAAYGVAAFGRIGPPERDTRGMADPLGIAEPWIGLLVLTTELPGTW